MRTGNACTPFCCKPEIVVSSTCRIGQEARGSRWVVLSAYWSGSRGTRHPTQPAPSLNARHCELRARKTLGLKDGVVKPFSVVRFLYQYLAGIGSLSDLAPHIRQGLQEKVLVPKGVV